MPDLYVYLPEDSFPAFVAGLLIASGLIYAATLLALAAGLVLYNRLRGSSLPDGGSADQHQSDLPLVSVLIAARNAFSILDKCLGCLARQNYPSDRIEVVVIDDGSTDDTENAARAWTDRIPSLKVVAVNSAYHVCPKKNALEHGIRASSGSIIFTTDADCRPEPGWIRGLLFEFNRPSPHGNEGTGPADESSPSPVAMVAGYAPLEPSARGILERLLALQGLLVAGLSAGSISIGVPLACSGRSLAYRRDAFNQVGGFADIGDIVGGDDVLLMRKFSASGRWRVRYCGDLEAAVASAPHRDGLWGRQIRYQSKAVHYGVPALLLFIPVYIFHLALAAGPILAYTYEGFSGVFAAAVASKVIVDATFAGAAALTFNDTRSLSLFPLVEAVSVPYIALVSALGALRRGATPWT